MARKPKQYEDDDGRTVVNMDVPGMPGYDHRREVEQYRGSSGQSDAETMTNRDARRFTFYAVLAALLVGLVIGGGLILFIVLMQLGWKLF